MPSPPQRSVLAHPGAGLPAGERLALSMSLKTIASLRSAKSAVKMFEQEWKLLSKLANHSTSYDIFQELQIPRVIGIEDSSRKWSVMMVLEHLSATNRDMLTAINALCDGIQPRGEIDVALYKPDADLSYESLERFETINERFVEEVHERLQDRGDLLTTDRYKHPWFGPLTGHQWCWLAAFHQKIHRRQTQKIIAMLGVA